VAVLTGLPDPQKRLRLLWMGDTKGNWHAFRGAFGAVRSKSNLKIMCRMAEPLRKVALLSCRRKVCSSVAEEWKAGKHC